MAGFDDWLTNEGIDIAIALGVGLGLYIIWRIVIYLLIRSFYTSGIRARQLSRRATLAANDVASKTNIVTSSSEQQQQDKDLSEEEKLQIEMRAKTIGGVIRTIGTCAIVLIVLISIMDAVGAPTNSLLTVAALSGLAIALAVSNSITDFVSGLFILVEGSYNIGDIVTINDIFGEIERMTLRVTYIRGLDGTLYTVPNGEIRIVANHNRGITITVSNVGITYESDIDKCINILNNEISEAVANDSRLNGKILEKPKVDGIGELADSSVNIRFMVKTKPGIKALVERVNNEYIHKYLKSELAYPTRRIIQEMAN